MNNPGCFTPEQLAALASAPKDPVFRDVPERVDLEKWDYISTDEEKGAAGPMRSDDQVWCLRHLWMRVDYPERDFFGGRSAGCHYRRRKL